MVEPEFSRVLTVCGRRDNTLSAILRTAWESDHLSTLTRKDPLQADGVHLSVISHITIEELQRRLSETDMANGFANRFRFGMSYRTKLLPDGGNWHHDPKLGARLIKALEFGRDAKRIDMNGVAARLWDECYGNLTGKRHGLAGVLCARAAPHVRRLALIYTLLDRAERAQAVHLKAALVVWRYCEDLTKPCSVTPWAILWSTNWFGPCSTAKSVH